MYHLIILYILHRHFHSPTAARSCQIFLANFEGLALIVGGILYIVVSDSFSLISFVMRFSIVSHGEILYFCVFRDGSGTLLCPAMIYVHHLIGKLTLRT